MGNNGGFNPFRAGSGRVSDPGNAGQAGAGGGPAKLNAVIRQAAGRPGEAAQGGAGPSAEPGEEQQAQAAARAAARAAKR